ncbi:hypothetical protein N7468_001805 [Penicillium chermesinum]|uniref:Uncharacterized protein n=1 Tax=Penicillium chermesinum TaxID=63820 RepID=A0A9W9PK85_9EURO|nr:uncharacterized protein N7468_001805 [Penicillium chermesinum]KAJ5246822.1 hypothetical protein N7468_001805 [Penicillium chermesinum]
MKYTCTAGTLLGLLMATPSFAKNMMTYHDMDKFVPACPVATIWATHAVCMLTCENMMVPTMGMCINNCTSVNIDCMAQKGKDMTELDKVCMKDFNSCMDMC